MVENVGIVSAKLLNAFFVHRTLNKNNTIRFKSFLHRVEISWMSRSRIQPSPVLMNCNGQRGNLAPRRHKQDPSADCSGISANTNWTKLLLVGRTRRSVLQDRIKDVRNVRSEVKLRTFVNSAL
jgi:uncharacterized membrane protein